MFLERGAILPSITRDLLRDELRQYGTVYPEEPLAPHTTFGVGGNASYYVLPKTGSALASLIEWCHTRAVPYVLLGGGSNVLFPDGRYSGVVIGTRGLTGVTVTPSYVDVGAGVRIGELLTHLHRIGIRGLDFLVGIPGTVGGAIAMNAGIPERTIGEVVERVWAIDMCGNITRFDKEECHFSYRSSRFRAEQLPILAARLRIDGPAYDAASLLARRRATQPTGAHSAGCVFKNPPGDTAGRLIDAAGLKGFRVGMAKVSEKHANFILNLGGARSADIRKLIDIVREKVYKSFCILLELEIEVIDG